MKLQAPFLQLPVLFDAAVLEAEIAALGEEGWLSHPSGYEGNDFLPLISAYGEPANEAFEGPMRPTPWLDRCPYLKQVLATLGATLGRTRLMRLSGQAEVNPHVDVNYYWRERMRVHVPVVTQPTVRFSAGATEINMKAGECWIFDTWSLHRVVNDAVEARIHLVADTVGGEGFWELVSGCRSATHPTPPGWKPREVVPDPAATPADLPLETVNVPVVMTPWEAREHTNFLYAELAPNQPAAAATYAATTRFLHVWTALWAAHGEDRAGWQAYRAALERLQRDLRQARAETLALQNGSGFLDVLFNLVVDPALADHQRAYIDGERRENPAVRTAPRTKAPRTLPIEPDPVFDRPIFVVNPPRSGSSVLFETLSLAPGLYTLGGENHRLLEAIPELSMERRGWTSNRLDAADADPLVVAELRDSFLAELRDRNGRRPGAGRLRMLEKTPKNALRIPFLAKAFPEARFVYLHRDPRAVLASMMEAWESGRFNTYAVVPGWRHPLNWSLLLTPGWQSLSGKPLNEVVAGQWAAAMGVLLDDLEAVPADRRFIARYEAFVDSPEGEIRRLAGLLDLEWDQTLGASVPLSGHTVSAPGKDKWMKRQAEIEAVLPGLQDLIARAERMTGE
ncbi:MAG: sulfotransferase [Caulobacteraceae bacterium]|nr:sulfotransferase [Caulobacteraceae bacterium]